MSENYRNGDGSTQGRSASNWSDPHQAPPKSNVIPFRDNREFEADLDTFEEWLKDAKPWTNDKSHYLHLVAQIVDNNEAKEKTRYRGALMLIRYSDSREVTTRFFGPNLIEVLKGLGAAW